MEFRSLLTAGSIGILLILSGCGAGYQSNGISSQDIANESACPNGISLSPKGLSALPDTYSGDGKSGIFKLDRIEYHVSGSNLSNGASAIASFVETIDPHASSGVTGAIQTQCYSGSAQGKFNMSLTLPLEISRSDMQVLGATDTFSYENGNVSAHALKTEADTDFYDYLSTADEVSLDQIQKKAFQPSDNELEIVFHDKTLMVPGEVYALAHYTYEPKAELSSAR